MLTQVENTNTRRSFAGFIAQCQAYKTMLTTAGLPISVDLPTLTAAYGQQLFDGLLKVDAGLNARYGLLRTDEARAKLVADTINLDGHDVIDGAAASLKQLEATYRQINLPGEGALHRDIPLSSFAGYHGLDFGKLLDDRTLSWVGNEHVKAYFDQLATAITGWKSVVNSSIKSGASVPDVLMFLADYFETNVGLAANAPVKVDEKILHFRMQQLRLADKIPR